MNLTRPLPLWTYFQVHHYIATTRHVHFYNCMGLLEHICSAPQLSPHNQSKSYLPLHRSTPSPALSFKQGWECELNFSFT